MYRHCMTEIIHWAFVHILNRNISSAPDHFVLASPMLLLPDNIRPNLVLTEETCLPHLYQPRSCCEFYRNVCVRLVNQGVSRDLTEETWPEIQPQLNNYSDCCVLFVCLNFLVAIVIRACLSPGCEADCACYAFH